MIPPNQGYSLSHDSSLNMIPRKNCYISGYKGPNEILQDVPDREQIVIPVIKVLDPDDETRTCRSPYKFSIRNNPEICHIGKTFISPNW